MKSYKFILLWGLIVSSPFSYSQTNYSNVANIDKYKYEPMSVLEDSENVTLTITEKNHSHIPTKINSLPVPIDVSNYNNATKNFKYKNLLLNSGTTGKCWDGAAKAYNLDPWLLMAVAKVESSFNNVAVNRNKNNSLDIGMMQINSIWLPTLSKFGIQTNDLLNPCTSIFVGAWIMAQNIKRFGYNKDGIGAYNSPGNVTIRRDYAFKVYKAYNEIIKDLYIKTN